LVMHTHEIRFPRNQIQRKEGIKTWAKTPYVEPIGGLLRFTFMEKLERQNMLATQKLLDIIVSKYDMMLIFHKNQTSKLSIFD
jgi:hypothetical protein